MKWRNVFIFFAVTEFGNIWVSLKNPPTDDVPRSAPIAKADHIQSHLFNINVHDHSRMYVIRVTFGLSVNSSISVVMSAQLTKNC